MALRRDCVTYTGVFERVLKLQLAGFDWDELENRELLHQNLGGLPDKPARSEIPRRAFQVQTLDVRAVRWFFGDRVRRDVLRDLRVQLSLIHI